MGTFNIGTWTTNTMDVTLTKPYDAEVEYLESTGTQWIDTLYQPNASNFGYVADIMFFNDLAGTRTIAGCWGPSWAGTGYCFSLGGNYRGGYAASNKNWRGGDGNTTTTPRIQLGVRSIVSVVNQNDEENGQFHVKITSPLVNETQLFDNPYSGNVQINTFAICGIKMNAYPGNIAEIAHCRIYRFQLLEYSTVVRDFIPVRFTNELGESEGALYDKVTKQLFRNQGTGSFL